MIFGYALTQPQIQALGRRPEVTDAELACL